MQFIEQETSHRACVVYGALPPETRRSQARLFNDPANHFDVLVASDAVGMGLNLNIRRVIFHALEKFQGTERVPISVSAVKQIAGRAGRRNSAWSQVRDLQIMHASQARFGACNIGWRRQLVFTPVNFAVFASNVLLFTSSSR